MNRFGWSFRVQYEISLNDFLFARWLIFLSISCDSHDHHRPSRFHPESLIQSTFRCKHESVSANLDPPKDSLIRHMAFVWALMKILSLPIPTTIVFRYESSFVGRSISNWIFETNTWYFKTNKLCLNRFSIKTAYLNTNLECLARKRVNFGIRAKWPSFASREKSWSATAVTNARECRFLRALASSLSASSFGNLFAKWSSVQ